MPKQLSTSSAFTREQVDLIKQTVARGATDAELSLFLYTAQRTGLDPLTRQIHAIKRWDSAAGRESMAIQTGIDGYRLIADRTGKLAGIEDAIFDREDRANPEKATVTVYKIINGEKCPFTASARWNEYCAFKKDGTPMALWKKMPYLMLGKCAEALALRKAFPADLSGLYTFEEMSQSENHSVPQIEIAKPSFSGGGDAAASSGEDIQPTQPEASRPAVTASEQRPLKAAARKTKQSNYSRLIEILKVGGYTGEDFMNVAWKNLWFPERITKLIDVPDPDLAEFIKDDNLTTIMNQLEAYRLSL